jgi:Protein of unknown function (DUF1552)
MAIERLSRRAVLRGAGACLALPLLDAMLPRRAAAQAAEAPKRFIGFFYPCGTDPNLWMPRAGALDAQTLSPALQDLAGFGAERIWPACSALHSEVTVVNGIDHSGVCLDIHMPSLAFSAHKGTVNTYTPGAPTLDQFLADKLAPATRFRNLALSATGNTDIGQGSISFRAAGQPETAIRSPKQLFDLLFASRGGDDAKQRARDASLLDGVRDDARSLSARLGSADRQRLEQYLQAVSELEKQVAVGGPQCSAPASAPLGGDWHASTKQFIDLLVLAMACDLTRVGVVQYSDSWGVNYADYAIGSGREALGSWSDHFISHKLGDRDRATDLDGLDQAEAMRIANARVLLTSRFKVRRFAYLLDALRKVPTPFGTLLDESLVLYASENGDGDSHARTNMPVLIGGHAGGFRTGRAIDARGQPTGALHASIVQKLGFDVPSYGDPAGKPISGF